MAKAKRRIWRWVLGALVLLFAALLGNALLVSSPAMPTEPAPEVPAIDDEGAIARLAALLRIATVSPRDDGTGGDAESFTRIHAELRRQFPTVHESLEVETVNELSLLMRWPGRDATLEPLVLIAHLDVVPVEPNTEHQWAQPPFDGVVDGGFLWGRGALDDKLSVSAILEAAQSLLGAGFEPQRTVWIAFGHDEEVGGKRGAMRLSAVLADRGVRAHLLLDEGGAIVEGTIPGVEQGVAFVGIAEKGYASVELRVRSEGGHSSMPPPQTAIGRLAQAVAAVQNEPLSPELRGPTAIMIDHLAPHQGLGMRLVTANRWLFGAVLARVMLSQPPSAAAVRTTTAATIFNGGVADNVLPQEANAVINFRLLPGDTVNDVLEHVRKTIDDDEVEVTCPHECWDPPSTSPIDERFEVLRTTILQVFPDVIVTPGLTLGGTDARHYQAVATHAYRFLPVRFGPTDRVRVHGTDERIPVDSVADATRFYMSLIKNVAG